MANMTYLLKIGNTDITPYLKKYEMYMEEMWDDAGRNMQGDLIANYVGATPKIELTFRELSQVEMSLVLSLLKRKFPATYWDEESDSYKTQNFYRGQLKRPLRSIHTKRYTEFGVNIIGFEAE